MESAAKARALRQTEQVPARGTPDKDVSFTSLSLIFYLASGAELARVVAREDAVVLSGTGKITEKHVPLFPF